MLSGQDRESRSSRRSARSRRLKSHSDHWCMVEDQKLWFVWRGIDWRRKMVILVVVSRRWDTDAGENWYSASEARWSCAYNSCRHASTQSRKKSSTEEMLTNATEDFVPQFGDEVGGRHSNQWGDRWSCSQERIGEPWSSESSFLVLQVIKTETLVQRARFASWSSIDLQSARIVWFERERKVAQDTEQKSVQIVCNSYEDPNVDDMKPSSNNRRSWNLKGRWLWQHRVCSWK